jgi:hypothetical protein
MFRYFKVQKYQNIKWEIAFLILKKTLGFLDKSTPFIPILAEN